MGGLARTVLLPGDWVRFDGGEHQVVAVAGTAVRLRATTGGEQVVLAAYLMATPEFAVVDGEPAPRTEPFGLLDSLPEAVLAGAREWERHVVEVETGLPPDAAPSSPSRPEFDPARTTLNERDAAKAAELGVSVRTIQSRRARYAQQGLWGLVDQRAVRTWEATGRADARLVTARAGGRASTHADSGLSGVPGEIVSFYLRLVQRLPRPRDHVKCPINLLGGHRPVPVRYPVAGAPHEVQSPERCPRRAT